MTTVVWTNGQRAGNGGRYGAAYVRAPAGKHGECVYKCQICSALLNPGESEPVQSRCSPRAYTHIVRTYYYYHKNCMAQFASRCARKAAEKQPNQIYYTTPFGTAKRTVYMPVKIPVRSPLHPQPPAPVVFLTLPSDFSWKAYGRNVVFIARVLSDVVRATT